MSWCGTVTFANASRRRSTSRLTVILAILQFAPLSPASDGERAYFHDGKNVYAIDMKTGKVAWEEDSSGGRSSIPFNFGPRLVVVDGVVVYAGGDRSMTAYEAKSGKKLWNSCS